jgi:hypothetical protein
LYFAAAGLFIHNSCNGQTLFIVSALRNVRQKQTARYLGGEQAQLNNLMSNRRTAMHKALMAFLFIVVLAALAPNAYGTGTISGVVTDSNSQNLDGIDVQVFNAINAVLVTDALTGANGPGFSISVPAGQYKLRFAGGLAKNGACYASQFYSSDGADSFDSGLVVTVSDGANTQADGQLVQLPPELCGPLKCVLRPPQGIQVGVFDSQTKQRIAGIQITLMNSVDALPELQLLTDGNGAAEWSAGPGCSWLDDKVRFSDPNGLYKANFYGASGQDIFDNGIPVDLETFPIINEPLARVGPSDVINNISQDVAGMGLDPSTVTELTGSLASAVKILTDNNPNNDKAACGILTGFKNKLDAKVKNGTLSQSQADVLMASAEQARSMLGCK